MGYAFFDNGCWLYVGVLGLGMLYGLGKLELGRVCLWEGRDMGQVMGIRVSGVVCRFCH